MSGAVTTAEHGGKWRDGAGAEPLPLLLLKRVRGERERAESEMREWEGAGALPFPNGDTPWLAIAGAWSPCGVGALAWSATARHGANSLSAGGQPTVPALHFLKSKFASFLPYSSKSRLN